ncbi:MAG: tetratricopeptide repeat protein, partial [Myxococcota bacterium]
MKTSRHLRIYAQALTVVVVFVVVVGVAHAQDAEAHYQQAIALFNEGQYQDALLSLDTAIALSPEESVFHCNRGAILLKLRDNAEALHALEVCLATYDGEESEMAQIDAEVQALRLVVRVIEPSALSVSVQSATAPTPPARSRHHRWTRPVGW